MNMSLNLNETCGFYCLCYKNESRKQIMSDKFASIGLNLIVYPGVEHTDPRIADRDIDINIKRLWSVTYGHLDMIQQFYDSGKPYGLFCEYDVVINKKLPELLPSIIEDFESMKLEFLLLGYMLTYKPVGWMSGYHVIKESSFESAPELGKVTYHAYPNDLWGVHLYMVNRSGAKKILDMYANEYADAQLGIKPFSPDWTISKMDMNRAIISPMVGVEDGTDGYDHYGHQGQYDFHMNTFRFNNVPDLFI